MPPFLVRKTRIGRLFLLWSFATSYPWYRVRADTGTTYTTWCSIGIDDTSTKSARQLGGNVGFPAFAVRFGPFCVKVTIMPRKIAEHEIVAQYHTGVMR